MIRWILGTLGSLYQAFTQYLSAGTVDTAIFSFYFLMMLVTHSIESTRKGRMTPVLTADLCSGDDDEFLPWHGILQTINLLLNTPYRDTDELKQNVVRRQPGKFEAEMFQISIFKASQIAKVLQLSSAEKPLIVYLIGDSSITAHYRLGVGINNIVTSLRQLRRLLDASVAFLMSSRKFSDTSRLREAVKAVERSSQKRLESMVQFQLSTMLYVHIATPCILKMFRYESYCNAVVFFDGEKSLFESQVVSARDDSSFGYHVLMEEELRELCDAGIAMRDGLIAEYLSRVKRSIGRCGTCSFNCTKSTP